MHSIETNHQINMTFVHSVSSNTLFKRYFNAKSFKMFWEYWSTCPKHDVAGSVSVAMVMRTYKGDVKKKTQKNSHHQTVSAETSFDDDSDKEDLNVHNVLPAIIEKNVYKLYSNITYPSQTVQPLPRDVLNVKHQTL